MKPQFLVGLCLLGTMFLPASSTAFTPTYVLTVDVSGMDGYDRVVSDPPGIDCTASGGACSSGFLGGNNIALAAVPQNGASWTSSLRQWGGACSGRPDEACVLAMDGDKGVTAEFVALGTPMAMMEVAVTISGDGTVVSSPEGLSCSGNTCTGTFPSGTAVALEAVPGTPPPGGSIFFIEWTGDCSGPGPCPLFMDSNKSVTAQFGALAPPPPFAAPAPSGRNEYRYHPVEEPEAFTVAEDMKPFAIGGDPETIALRLRLAYADPIDVYVGIAQAGTEDVVLIGPADALSLLSAGPVKWKENSQHENIDHAFFGPIPAALFPPGVYRLFAMVTPAGDEAFLNYDFWETYFEIRPVEGIFVP